MKSRYLYYILLLALLSIAVTYQARYTMDGVRSDLYPHEQVRAPFVMENVEPIITRLRPESEAAGLQKGDRVLSVGDHALTGSAIFDQLAVAAHPGDPLNITVSRGQATGGAEEKRLTLRWAANKESPPTISEWLPHVLAFVVMPVFCLLLGFWVTMIRPRDPLACDLLLRAVRPRDAPPHLRQRGPQSSDDLSRARGQVADHPP